MMNYRIRGAFCHISFNRRWCSCFGWQLSNSCWDKKYSTRKINFQVNDIRKPKCLFNSFCRFSGSNPDETIVFYSQRLCQMLTTFDNQWSKQTSIPTILLHGLDDFNEIIDYACRQCGYHCHAVRSFSSVNFPSNRSFRYPVNYSPVTRPQQQRNELNMLFKP